MEQTTTTERKFEVSGQARLTLANISGSVDIQPGDDGVIWVVAKVDNHSGDTERTRVEMDQAEDGSVTVKTDYGESFWRWMGQRPCDVDYTVRVPRSCWLQLKCISSKAAVAGLAGQFNLSMVSGDLSVAALTGSLKANLVSGNFTGEQLSGQADIETVSGKVGLLASQFESLKVSTVSGRVRVESPLVNSPFHFRSVSGDVQLKIPADTHCSIESTSLSGRIDTNLPVTYSNKSGQHWHMDVQGGGTEVRFDSISGTLHVNADGVSVAEQRAPSFAPTQKAVEAPAEEPLKSGSLESGSPKGVSPEGVPPAPQTPEDQSALTRRDILDRVSRGELSVDDAVNQLRG